MPSKTPDKPQKTGVRRRKPGGRPPGRGIGGPSDARPQAKDDELIDMNEAMRLLKTTRPTFYRWLRAGRVKGMKIGRQWRFYREDIDRFLKGRPPRIDLPADITPLIGTLRERLRSAGARPGPSGDMSELEEAVGLIVSLAGALNASDIHIAPHLPRGAADAVVPLRYRIDGVLHEVAEIDPRLLPATIEETKRRANCDVHLRSRPQDGRFQARLVRPAVSGTSQDRPSAVTERTVDIRACFVPSALGEAVTLRILDPGILEMSLNRIEYADHDKERLMRALRAPSGLIVISGPTGSGKTTVLYACLGELARPELKLMSVEDPIEYFLPWVTQVAVNPQEGMGFTGAVWTLLRSDPDVVMIGEIRDLETLSAAQEIVLSGHLVLTQMHAGSASEAIRRMIDLGSDPYSVAETTKIVLAQRLVRKLCPDCAVADSPAPERLDRLAEIAADGGLTWPAVDHRFKKPVGCEKCSGTGYRRRNVIAEVLEVTPEIARAIRAGKSSDELERIAAAEGMTSLAADGVRRAAMGETTIDEVARVLGLEI